MDYICVIILIQSVLILVLAFVSRDTYKGKAAYIWISPDPA